MEVQQIESSSLVMQPMQQVVSLETSEQSSIMPLVSSHKQMIVLVRQSLRADDPSIPTEIQKKQDPIHIEYDPHLCRPNGKEMAFETAKFLKRQL